MVIGIIALLAGMTIGVSQAVRAKGRRDRTRTLIDAIDSALADYHASMGRWPAVIGETEAATDYQELCRLLLSLEAVGPADVRNDVVVDAWGNRIRARTGGHASPAPDIWSVGPNGVSDVTSDPEDYGDDVVNWHRE